MSALPPNNTRFTNVLLSVMAAGFLAWAGVVWQASQNISETVGQIFVSLGVIEANLVHIQANLVRHEELPWHGTVGVEIERLKGR